MRFALLEAKLALANIVRKYNLLPNPKTKEPLEWDPTPAIAYVKNGLYIKVEKRNWIVQKGITGNKSWECLQS